MTMSLNLNLSLNLSLNRSRRLCFPVVVLLSMSATVLSLIPKSSYNRLVGTGRTVHLERNRKWPSNTRLKTTQTSSTLYQDIDGTNHTKTYRIQGETTPNSKGSVTMTTNTGHAIQTDLPKPMGGKDEAPQPVETLLAALIGCTQATALFVGRQMKPNRLLIDKMEFSLTATRDERGALQLPIDIDPPVPSRLQQVSGTIRVFAAKGARIPNEQMTLLREQTEQRCPVANMMLASGCAMKVEWIDGSPLSIAE
jgi:putative redox protein